MMRTPFAIAGVLALVVAPTTLAQHDHGRVSFSSSCTDAATVHLRQGVALLHHMMYEQAATHFQAAADGEPDCAMAYWGIAMSQMHPLWAPPTNAELEKGRSATEKARSLSPPTERESAYVAAVEAFFMPGSASFAERLAAWEAGMQAVHAAAPEDVDAAAFYALSRLATAPRDDKTFARNAEVGAELQALHRANPDHPGLFHYTIHAYDNPVLAAQALEVARAYDKLAPNVPHALHMPSHIFVRLGHWDDVISWNRRSANAALEQPSDGVVLMHYPHAIDYLVYAHLQKGDDVAAQAALDELLAEERPIQPVQAAAYGLAAARARVLLERGDWDAAARMETRIPEEFPWDLHPSADAILEFARGIGAARTGDVALASASADHLDLLHGRLVEAGDSYWAIQVDAQRTSVRAWKALAEDKPDEALALMREAADLEDSVDKHPVTPSAVRPARELLAEMLMEVGQPAEAIEAYDATLAISPGRLNALYGAGHAAELMDDEERAMSYYRMAAEMLLEEPARAELQKMRGYMAGGR